MFVARKRSNGKRSSKSKASCWSAIFQFGIGIVHFRLEFVHESAAQVTRVTRAFADYLAGRTSTGELNSALKRISPQGITEGSLYVPKDYLTLPVLQ